MLICSGQERSFCSESLKTVSISLVFPVSLGPVTITSSGCLFLSMLDSSFLSICLSNIKFDSELEHRTPANC